MEVQEVMLGVRDVGGGGSSSNDGLERQVSSVRESENLGADLLEDLDLYLEDIDDRLTISRMVSDSVIKGIVKAVDQVAAEKIAAKELEVPGLKERLHFHQLGADKIESSGSPVAYHEPRSMENGLYCSFSDALVENGKMRESLCSLRSVAREQIQKLKKEIDGIRGWSSMRSPSSGPELLGLGRILQEKVSKRLVRVDKTLDSLTTVFDTICTLVDDMVHLDKASLCEWQQEQEFQRELEAMVIQRSIRSLHEEFEEKLWDQNACLCGSQSMNWLDRINEISNLCKELDVILKSLSNPETAQLVSHESHDMDHIHRKALSNHVLSSTSPWEGNGIFEDSKNGMPENWDAAQLKLMHMTKEALVNYFNTVITKMRRNHESELQKMTEEYFCLKRDYLKEKGSSLPLRKDKDFDMLRKKIPEVILKLDDILVENEKFSTLSNNNESLGRLKDRLSSLLSENRQLRNSLTDERNKMKCLSSQVSDASEKMLQHSLTEAKVIGNLKYAVEDAEIETSVTEEVYKCVLREVIAQINCDTEELEMQSIVMKEIYEIFYREAAQDAEAKSMYGMGDSDIEYLVMQGLCGVIFREAIKDAQSQINELNAKYVNEHETRVSLEHEIEEKERLKQVVLSLEKSLKEKEKLALALSAELLKERERFELASKESNLVKEQASRQQILVSERSKELDIIKVELAKALEQIEVHRVETNRLDQKLELMTKELREADEQRNMKQNDILLLEAKENEQRKQMRAIIILVHGLSKALSDFEHRVAEGIKKNNLRLEESSSQLSSLIQKSNVLKRTASLYKQRLEKRCADIHMAEAEVDLLGDKVETHLSLLEKIYIALDHYSPILKHYPGVVEILKLVRKELSGESIKPV